jgi:hypothetical protein
MGHSRANVRDLTEIHTRVRVVDVGKVTKESMKDRRKEGSRLCLMRGVSGVSPVFSEVNSSNLLKGTEEIKIL